MKNGVICLGEALIDFIPLDQENISLQKSPGGAPANVAVGVAQLGTPSTFLGKVGDDVMGRFLQKTLQDFHVNTNYMLLSKEHRTGIVFVTLAANGERSFDFYIDPSADRFLQKEEIESTMFKENNVLHFGSISLIDDPARTATMSAVQLAKENGVVISYDPNLRLGLWKDAKEAKERIISMLEHADVLKISDEELTFITGETNIEKGIAQLEAYNIPFILVTLGEDGSYVVTKDGYAHVPARKVKAVDTTGAGDAFVSGILYSVNEFSRDLSTLTLEEAVQMAQFASVSGGLAASTKGAMTALPTKTEVEQLLQNDRG
ncbi:aminoimidazole riboside kinase [Salirhabdus salicampi]|uniref:aminoimidazole riboside kinase n=1 Tax=Salirhabdus salicampi TaxID=476102 RepID=UPI0020C49313|nr:aminoimidazole riboside kinase [Salirhabdus salicampi]MCP8616753.1 aminoimidazole riboside kinase [Salirhabdus salicampi]